MPGGQARDNGGKVAIGKLRIDDPRVPPAAARRLDRWLCSPLRDERDLVFMRIAVVCAAFVGIGAALIYAAPPAIQIALAPVYWFVLFTRLSDRFAALLHAIAHRPAFQKRAAWIESAIRYGLSPFFGLSPHLYFALHVGMHHFENNGAHDLTSTAPYRRDNVIDFARYALRFVLLGPIELVLYLRANERTKAANLLAMGTVLHLGVLATLLVVAPIPTFIVFGMPALLMPLALIAGNWAQHALVDPDEPTNLYRNSITLLNSRHNRRCYNDGYHLVHHLRPGLHWSEIPDAFESSLERLVDEDPVVLDGVDGYRDVWLDLMLKRYERMAARMIDLGDRERSIEERVELLRARTRPAAFPAER